MRNSTQPYSSYAGAQKIMLDAEAKKKERVSIGRNIFKFVLYIIAFAFLMWVYYRWQRIPVRKHSFRTEYIASADSSFILRAKIYITIPKVLDIDSVYFSESDNQNTVGYKDYYEHYKISSDHAKKVATPIHPSFKGHLSDYVGLPLYNELSDSCKHSNTYIEKFSDVIYFEHLDNEKLPYKKYKRDSLNFYKERIYIVEKNKYFTNDSTDANLFDLYHFNLINTSISNDIIKDFRSGYNNITQSLILTTPYPRNTPESFFKIRMPSNFHRFFSSLIALEDISQSYYKITLSSNTIPEVLLKMDFVGSIDCNFTKNPNINHLDNKCSDINIGRSFIQLLKKNKENKNILFLVKFNDMQNMQTTRLFILGVLITLTLTKLFGVIWRIIRIPIIKVWSKKCVLYIICFTKKRKLQIIRS